MKIISYIKASLVFILIYLLPIWGSSQVQDLGIPFQGIAKDYSGNIVNQRTIYIEIAVVTKEQPLDILYKEVHQSKTDEWGLFAIQIGKGRWINGSKKNLSLIDWSTGNHQLS
ncbi:MAG: hypothetical protein ACO25Q_08010, partial [Sediminibacterium sp.]